MIGKKVCSQTFGQVMQTKVKAIDIEMHKPSMA